MNDNANTQNVSMIASLGAVQTKDIIIGGLAAKRYAATNSTYDCRREGQWQIKIPVFVFF